MGNLSDKKKIFILRAIIVFIVLLIGIFSVVAIMDFRSDKNDPKYLSTTTRRTYKKESTTTTKLIVPSTTEGESTTTTESTTTIKLTTTTTKGKGTTKRQNPSTKKPTTKSTTTTKSQSGSSTSPFPEVPEYTEATGPTNHANAEDSWEWYIVNKINDIREQNGLNRLIVAVELRELAEDAGDIYNTQGEEAVNDFLEGYNNYRYMTINKNVSKDYLVNNTVDATSVTTNKYYKYVGVGVIKHVDSQNGLPSYHYCIIYQ